MATRGNQLQLQITLDLVKSDARHTTLNRKLRMQDTYQYSIGVNLGLTPYKCGAANCGRVFKSLSSLNRHKNKQGHTAKTNRKEPVGKKRASEQPTGSSKLQRTLRDMLKGAEAREIAWKKIWHVLPWNASTPATVV